MKPNARCLSALCAAVLASVAVPAAAAPVTVEGVTYPDTMTVGGRTLRLIGVGLREVSFLGIDVYTGAVYAETRSCDLRRLATTEQARVFRMDFLRDIPAKKQNANMRKMLDNALPGDASPELKRQVDDFVALFNEDAKKGMHAEVRYVPGTGLSVMIEGRQRGPIFQGADFGRLVFSVWFGPKTCCENMLEGMRETCAGE